MSTHIRSSIYALTYLIDYCICFENLETKTRLSTYRLLFSLVAVVVTYLQLLK